MVKSKRLILASGSVRRKELLEEAGYRFDVVVPHLDEPADKPAVSAESWAESIAYFKARQVVYDPDAVVIAADTIVVCNGEIIGKAKDVEEARRMLDLLSHNRHSVITGVAVICGEDRVIDSASSQITMKPMSCAEIDAYVSSGAWEGKSGAYALRQGGDKFVSQIRGSYTNIIGLPMELVPKMLKRFGIEPLGE